VRKLPLPTIKINNKRNSNMKLKLIQMFLGICIISCSHSELQKNEIQKAEISQSDGEIRRIKGSFNISGIYPHLTTYTHGRVDGKNTKELECGIGGIVEWNNKIYMINYGAHNPHGSEHKLYIVDEDLNMEIFSGSVGGTPAGRMIHQESNQLFIGPYVIDWSGNIRVIDINKMPGRLTAIARHLEDPVNKVYYYDMEGMLYEVDVHSLEPKLLYKNPLPGWHGKGAYTAQGKLILANNGEIHGALESIKHWKVDTTDVYGKNKNGVLADFDGKNFNIVERRQFTDVTTKHGINAVPNDQSPIWTIGWDKYSVRLKVMEEGKWNTYLLPKANNNNDPSHGWFTEWPRIREIHDGKYMMDMHGMFYEFPPTFSSSNTSGLKPIGSHLRYVPDFTHWNGKILLATDETSIQGNPLAGQAQSNLWLGDFSELSKWGPASGYGSVWIEDQVKANEASLPYLFSSFDQRILHLSNHGDEAVEIKLQIDKQGDNNWKDHKTVEVPAKAYVYHIFDKNANAEWIRLVPIQSSTLTATFHYTDTDLRRPDEGKELFKGLAASNYQGTVSHSKLFPNQNNFNLTVYTGDVADGSFTEKKTYELNKYDFTYAEGLKDSTSKKALKNHVIYSVDEASIILKSEKFRLRLPKGKGTYSPEAIRNEREVESERVLANLHGTFYEIPLYKVGSEPLYKMIRPVSTHNRQITDFATWNGLLLMSGIQLDNSNSEHIIKNKTEDAALWVGGIDDIWKFGKPVGEGGVWKNSAVKANEPSDIYLMTGYDHKTVTLTADKDVEITLSVYHTHYSNNPVVYKTFKLKANKAISHTFPSGYSVHWISAESNKDCNATAWFSYK
jgi:hypothetical protein